MLSPRSTSARLWILTLTLVCASCGGDSHASRTVSDSVSENVTASGATIVGPAGTGVEVPAGALSADVTIVASALGGVRAPAGTAVVGQAVRLGPEGTTFEKPVEVTIPIAPSSLPAGTTLDDVVVVRSQQNSSVFVPLPTRRHASGMAVVAATEHFSDFVPVVIDANATPFGSCGDAMCLSGETCGSCPADCGVCVAAGICGNGSCEPNASEACDLCAFDCGTCAGGTCGDGAIDVGEKCDPGFTTGTTLERCLCDDGDACTTDAQVSGTPSACDVVCTHTRLGGFGIDSCDDGLACTIDTQGTLDPLTCTLPCSNTPLDVNSWGAFHCNDSDPCTIDMAIGYDSLTCATSSCMHMPIGGCVVTCGDGFLGGSEVCDDGNVMSNDGCDASCTTLEAGYACPLPGVSCYLGACGNGTLEGPEGCDDGNAASGDGCDAICLGVDVGYTCPIPGMNCAPLCGDGLVILPETCDDTNTSPTDGCDGNCTVEAGFTCPPTGGMCTMIPPVCGDGVKNGTETCDDGPNNGTYGFCNGTCNGLAGYCGDLITQGPQENCDDGPLGTCAEDCLRTLPAPNAMRHIFETGVVSGNLGGTAGADALCMASPNRRTTGTFKAILVDANRSICTSPYCGSGSTPVDWVLLPSTTYYMNSVGNEVAFMTTDGNAIVTQAMLGGVLGGGTNFWIGMYADWQAHPQNCLNFTTNSNSYGSPVGWDAGNTSAGFFAGGSYMCDALATLVCVEQ